jgi:hypothetical protein
MRLKTTRFLRECLAEARSKEGGIGSKEESKEEGREERREERIKESMESKEDSRKESKEKSREESKEKSREESKEKCKEKCIKESMESIDEWVDHDLVILASKTLLLSSNNNPKYLLGNMLRNVKIIKPLPVFKPTKEYIALMDSFKVKLWENQLADRDSDLRDLRSVNRLIVSIFNLLLSVACVFFAAFYFSPFLDLPFVPKLI